MDMTHESAQRVESVSSATATPVSREPADSRALSILAKTLYRQLRTEGYSAQDLVTLSSELIAQISTELRDERE
jgi:hypothetical protein